MSTRRHSVGSSIATRRHALHTNSALHKMSWASTLRKTSSRASWGSFAQSLTSREDSESGFLVRRLQEEDITTVLEPWSAQNEQNVRTTQRI